jgi:hypothetical protein
MCQEFSCDYRIHLLGTFTKIRSTIDFVVSTVRIYLGDSRRKYYIDVSVLEFLLKLT